MTPWRVVDPADKAFTVKALGGIKPRRCELKRPSSNIAVALRYRLNPSPEAHPHPATMTRPTIYQFPSARSASGWKSC